MATSVYLWDVLVDVDEDVEIDFLQYWKSEKKISELLEEEGYELEGDWFTSEGDSFGPLIRAIVAFTPKNKDRILIWYG